MALNIKDEGADRVVRELAAATGESITVAVETAARERLERLRGVVPYEERLRRTEEIVADFHALPVLDDRTPDEILGYDENGLPT